VAAAALLLEQQAAQRKQRQDAARALREQQDEERRRRSMRNGGGISAAAGAVPAGSSSSSTSAAAAAAARRAAAATGSGSGSRTGDVQGSTGSAGTAASIRAHEEEIAELTAQLEAEDNTVATAYALKKAIAVRKAALLRERRAAAQRSYLEDDEGSLPVPVGAGSAAARSTSGRARYGAQPAPSSIDEMPISSKYAVQQQHSPENGFSAQRPVPVGLHSQYDDGFQGSEGGGRGGGIYAAAPVPAQPLSFDDMPVGGGGGSQRRAATRPDIYASHGAAGVGEKPQRGARPKWNVEVPKRASNFDFGEENVYYAEDTASEDHRWQQQQQQQGAYMSPRDSSFHNNQNQTAGSGQRGRKGASVGAASAPFANEYSWDVNSPP
jgi:hypothetical protein